MNPVRSRTVTYYTIEHNMQRRPFLDTIMNRGLRKQSKTLYLIEKTLLDISKVETMQYADVYYF